MLQEKAQLTNTEHLQSSSLDSLIHVTHQQAIAPLEDSELARIEAWTEDIKADPERLQAIATQISETVHKAWLGGHYILPKSSEEITEKLSSGQAALIPAMDTAGNETFHYFRSMLPLVEGENFDEFPVIEGGTLIRNPDRQKIEGWQAYRSSHAIQIANNLPALPDNTLIINTSRSKASKQAGLRAGAVMMRREFFPMLDALTCDPGCRPGSDGRAAGVENVIRTDCGDCIACPVNEAHGGSALTDGCYLLTPDPARAVEVEQSLFERFDGQASRARAVLIDGEDDVPHA